MRRAAQRALIVAAAVVIAGCTLPFFTGAPRGGLSPRPGTYSESIHVNRRSGDERYYATLNADADIGEFEEFQGVFITGDTTFWYYTISSSGVRSEVFKAEYIINDSAAPVITSPGIYSSYQQYFEIDIYWDRWEPTDGGDGDATANAEPSPGNPHDDITPFWDLEYALFSAPGPSLATIEEATSTGQVEFDWRGLGTDENWWRARVSYPGESRWYNLFVRDGDGNVSAYGQVAFASRPALSLVFAEPGGDAVTRLHDNVWGSYQYPSTISHTGISSAKSFNATDLDGDGYLDIAYVSFDGLDDNFRWVRGLGNGRYDSANEIEFYVSPTPLGSGTIEFADMNQDGTLDIIFNDGAGNLIVRTTGSTPTELMRYTATPAVHEVSDFSVGDINGDGYPDIISQDPDTPSGDPDRVYVHLNTGISLTTIHSTAADISNLPLTSTTLDTGLGDFDNDGNLDLAVADDAPSVGLQGVQLYYGNGDGTFTEDLSDPLTWLEDVGVNHVTVTDFSAPGGGYPDGIDDIFAGTIAGPDNAFFISNGDRTFGDPSTTTLGPDQSLRTTVGDLNYDGYPDLIHVVSSAASPKIYLNYGTSIIEEVPSVPFSGTATHVAIGRVR